MTMATRSLPEPTPASWTSARSVISRADCAQDMILWVAKFNGATGATMAAKAFGTTGKLEADGLASDAQGNVILSGSLFAPVTFEARRSRRSEKRRFVTKLDASLVPIWARRWEVPRLGHRRERGRGLKWKCNRRGPVQHTIDVARGTPS